LASSCPISKVGDRPSSTSDDCVAGAPFLAAQGRVNRKRCVISGCRAGGYTTLAALTLFFQGGASYYG
jgi:dipeptidyl aminopeptidase/acylaminoacyl peptidase